mmetsp:Transcript_52517/g.152957  ORF Transcript_52517/g.152957 Transcript_52517/m.152957 type:complete len:201 (+) Transcript_52517:589-1191(+)
MRLAHLAKPPVDVRRKLLPWFLRPPAPEAESTGLLVWRLARPAATLAPTHALVMTAQPTGLRIWRRAPQAAASAPEAAPGALQTGQATSLSTSPCASMGPATGRPWSMAATIGCGGRMLRSIGKCGVNWRRRRGRHVSTEDTTWPMAVSSNCEAMLPLSATACNSSSRRRRVLRRCRAQAVHRAAATVARPSASSNMRRG